jgi:chromosome segregation ATPase
MATTQQIRRTPGLPATLSGQICDTLTTHSQLFNNAVREIVDDASEIRIQIEEANQALMTLKVQESTAQHELSQMEKRIEEQVSKVEVTEDRLAKYHSDAEKDRNEVREHLAKLKDEEDTEAKEKIIEQLLQVREQH